MNDDKFNPNECFKTSSSLAAALRAKYRISPAGDGEGTVFNPSNNKTYTVSNFECDCPASTYRKGEHCKHEIWLSQMRPCPHCDRYQLLAKVKVAGSDDPLFEFRCSNGHISTWEQVERERTDEVH